jgi:hypothetical protein
LSQQFFSLAPHQHDLALVLESHIELGLMAFFRSDPVTARAHLEQSLHLGQQFPLCPKDPMRPMSEASLGAI